MSILNFSKNFNNYKKYVFLKNIFFLVLYIYKNDWRRSILPNRFAVSNDALYNLKPTSCRGRAYRGSVPPTNKSTFNPSDTMIFYIPGGRRNTFLDGTQNYLKLTIKNSDTTSSSELIYFMEVHYLKQFNIIMF